MLVARALPDVAGFDKEFDYSVPASLARDLRAGSVVSVPLHGRKVRAWVTAFPAEPATGAALLAIERAVGWGPEPELVGLAPWAAWRWAGKRRSFLVTASPLKVIRELPERPGTPPIVRAPSAPTSSTGPDLLRRAWRPGTHILRLPPASSATELVQAAAERGAVLVLAATKQRAEAGAAALRRRGARVALLPDEWPQARSGAEVVIGTRRAAWGPCPDLASVVVLDAHDEGYVQEQSPSWDAAVVVAERARRAGAPCFWVSACPTLEMQAAAEVVRLGPSAEREGWAPLLVADRRGEDPRLGLYSQLLVQVAREEERRLVCVLNRKGRAVLLDCAACGELATCESCGAAVAMAERELVCRRCGSRRPVVCSSCASDALRLVRPGVSHARDELEALLGRPTAEVVGGAGPVPDAAVVVGTESVLYREAELRQGGPVGTVAFLDFDQEMFAPRYRAGEEALALLARASRIVGGRPKQGRVLVQTRAPGHAVIAAAQRADPEVLSVSEAPLRKALRLPPCSALALLTGPGAPAMASSLETFAAAHATGTLEVTQSDRERWVVKAQDQASLSDALAAAPRPQERVRIEVGPVRF